MENDIHNTITIFYADPTAPEGFVTESLHSDKTVDYYVDGWVNWDNESLSIYREIHWSDKSDLSGWIDTMYNYKTAFAIMDVSRDCIIFYASPYAKKDLGMHANAYLQINRELPNE